MPNITGIIGGAYNYVFGNGTSALISSSFGTTNNVGISGNDKDNIHNGMTLNASLSSSIYGGSNTVTPSSLSTTFIVRY